MGCGCGKGGGARAPRGARMAVAAPGGKTTRRVAVYEVVKDGKPLVTTESPTQARSEARRLKASVRVSSRAA